MVAMSKKESIPHPDGWDSSKARRGGSYCFTCDNGSKLWWVSITNPAFAAWSRVFREKGKKVPLTDNGGGGWYFPTEYPPGVSR